ncbi:hypothetical protein BMT91_17895 [Escherichia coli]|uniref:Uncharacterized protein n=1 Tax=Escherichia coli TaxID=562 RepID=A0AAX0KBS3_ECOLX|nr:hypothetical protein BMT91_17895 [Escherichia coli]
MRHSIELCHFYILMQAAQVRLKATRYLALAACQSIQASHQQPQEFYLLVALICMFEKCHQQHPPHRKDSIQQIHNLAAWILEKMKHVMQTIHNCSYQLPKAM